MRRRDKIASYFAQKAQARNPSLSEFGGPMDSGFARFTRARNDNLPSSLRAKRSNPTFSKDLLDCFVAIAPRNDDVISGP
jgi:hypothetical protein